MHGSFPEAAWPRDFLLSRRLVPSRKLPRTIARSAGLPTQDSARVGRHCKPEQSELTPPQCPTFLGAAIDIPAGLAHLGSDRIDTVVAATVHASTPLPVGPGQSVARVSGVSCEFGACFAGLPPADQTLPTVSSQLLLALEGPPHTVDTQSTADLNGVSMLDQEGGCLHKQARGNTLQAP